jgi:hypothetical protein
MQIGLFIEICSAIFPGFPFSFGSIQHKTMPVVSG